MEWWNGMARRLSAQKFANCELGGILSLDIVQVSFGSIFGEVWRVFKQFALVHEV